MGRHWCEAMARGPTSGLKLVPAVCVMQGSAESWPIDNSLAGRASHGVEWRSLAKAETISSLHESSCGASYWHMYSSRRTPGVRPWLLRQQTRLHDRELLQVTQRLLTAVFATQAADRVLESEL
jgi:hypothetical protein